MTGQDERFLSLDQKPTGKYASLIDRVTNLQSSIRYIYFRDHDPVLLHTSSVTSAFAENVVP